MKTDLATLSNNAGISLGQFVREILISHFLGHTVWPERDHSLTAEQREIADNWVNGQVAEGRVGWDTPEERDSIEGRVETISW